MNYHVILNINIKSIECLGVVSSFYFKFVSGVLEVVYIYVVIFDNFIKLKT